MPEPTLPRELSPETRPLGRGQKILQVSITLANSSPTGPFDWHCMVESGWESPARDRDCELGISVFLIQESTVYNRAKVALLTWQSDRVRQAATSQPLGK